jgi:Protein of unknown function (DUF3631)/CHC2 zinc finger
MSENVLHEAKRRLILPALLHQLGLGDLAKKSARCPFHDDQRNSFSVFKGESGAWFWKCHAGCGQGDEITFLEKHKGIATGEAIRQFRELAGYAPTDRAPALTRKISAEKTNNNRSFDWQACVDALTESDLERLGSERCYSRAFCEWLHEKQLLGAHNGCIAFPNGNGTFTGAHVWKGKKDWFHHPSGLGTRPFVIGSLSQAKQIHLFESQWDMLAFADRSGNYEAQGWAFVATRGASNACLIKSLLPEGASVMAWPQNDAPGEKWLSDLAAFIPKLGVGRVPATISKLNEFGEKVEVALKDLNDWTKAGATAEEIYAAFWRNELFKPVLAENTTMIPGEIVCLTDLLTEVCHYVKRYVVFTGEAQSVVVALWIAHTWAIEAFDYTPYLQVTAPEKQCGKSRVLDCLEPLTPKAWRAISPSEAVLYHKIDVDKPTLLLDETDTLFAGGKDDRGELLRSLLNAGFERKAKVPRCVNKGEEIKEYSVFCPKAFAGIGSLPDTITDRCVPIRLKKKRRNETVERFRKREAEQVASPIRERFEAWAKDEKVLGELRVARPPIPDALSDRQADICEPLLAIADLAEGAWPQRARDALVELCVSEENEESTNVKLLSDIRYVFGEQATDRLSTIDLLKALIDLDTENPWAPMWERDVNGGNTKGAGSRLAQKLKRFAIHARTIKLSDGSTAKGFLRSDFEDAWSRYLIQKLEKR